MKIAHANFWPTFSLHDGLVKYLLDLAFGQWEETISQKDADLILTSVYPHQPTAFPGKSIALIWENMRPDYRLYPFSISSDFDDYGGHNVRCPVWYSQIQWDHDMVLPKPSGWCGAHSREPLVQMRTLMTPRTEAYVPREKFCAIVASGYEPFRQMVAGMLNSIGHVDAYGMVFGKVEPRSKYEILRDHTFSLCFENSLFPGYYTEKPLHAWVAGTIPLYFADGWVTTEFNPLCFLNRYKYATTEEFIAAVRYFCDNKEVQEEMWRQPLLTKEPTLTPVIEFLRKAYDAIVYDGR